MASLLRVMSRAEERWFFNAHRILNWATGYPRTGSPIPLGLPLHPRRGARSGSRLLEGRRADEDPPADQGLIEPRNACLMLPRHLYGSPNGCSPRVSILTSRTSALEQAQASEEGPGHVGRGLSAFRPTFSKADMPLPARPRHA